jgi:hypothetical protein
MAEPEKINTAQMVLYLVQYFRQDMEFDPVQAADTLREMHVDPAEFMASLTHYWPKENA